MTWAIFLKVGIVSVWSIVEKTLNHILSGFLKIILCQSREWATAREWPDLDQQYTLSFHRFISREDAFPEGHSCGHCWPGTGSYAATLASKELALQAVMKHGYPAGRALLESLDIFALDKKTGRPLFLAGPCSLVSGRDGRLGGSCFSFCWRCQLPCFSEKGGIRLLNLREWTMKTHDKWSTAPPPPLSGVHY